METSRKSRGYATLPGPQSLQSLKARPHVIKPVDLQSHDRRARVFGSEVGEELTEIDLTLAHRQMVVLAPMVVVKVQLTDEGAQYLQPLSHRGASERRQVAAIEAKTHPLRSQPLEQLENLGGSMLVHIFENQGR